MKDFIFDLQRFENDDIVIDGVIIPIDPSHPNTYLISTPEQLQSLMTYVNGTAENEYSDAHTCEGLTFKLAPVNEDGNSINTLDLSSITNWTPIGKCQDGFDKQLFLGTFDGDGKTISGLKITGNDSYVGLFGVVGEVSGSQNIGNVVGSNFGGTVSEDCYYYKNDDDTTEYSDKTLTTQVYKLDLVSEDVTVTDGAVATIGDETYYKKDVKIECEQSYLKVGDKFYEEDKDGKFSVTLTEDAEVESYSTFFETFEQDKTDRTGKTYLIDTEDDVKRLENYINNDNDCNDLTFKLAANVTLDVSDFNPIGSGVKFVGNDGDNKIEFGGRNNTVDGGKGNDLYSLLKGSANNVILLSKDSGDDSIEGYTDENGQTLFDGYEISIQGSRYDKHLVGDNVVLVSDNGKDSLTIIDGKGKDLDINGTELNITRDLADMLTYDKNYKAVTLNGANDPATGKLAFEGKLGVNDYDSTVVTIDASAVVQPQGPVTIEANANNNLIIGSKTNENLYVYVPKNGDVIGSDTIQGFRSGETIGTEKGGNFQFCYTEVKGSDLVLKPGGDNNYFVNNNTLTLKNVFSGGKDSRLNSPKRTTTEAIGLMMIRFSTPTANTPSTVITTRLMRFS